VRTLPPSRCRRDHQPIVSQDSRTPGPSRLPSYLSYGMTSSNSHNRYLLNAVIAHRPSAAFASSASTIASARVASLPSARAPLG